ncbi:MAG: hypothetical protein PHH08_03445, partial [Candidatus ainarchaeum sp.]|nr:hypothetical protein [Candidatus ainarchaeum sp.]
MLILRKFGISFCLVQERFDSFIAMSKVVKTTFERNKGKPVAIVFPELALGQMPVSRKETKTWLREVQEMAKRHGNGYIFLSILEASPLKKGISNTGYMIGPSMLNSNPGKPMHWKAYAKFGRPDLDRSRILQTQSPDKAAARWDRRAGRKAIGEVLDKLTSSLLATNRVFRFPRVKINGRIVELRVCCDISALNEAPVDVLVVPAWGWGLDSRPERIMQSLKAGGYAIANDVWGSDPAAEIAWKPKKRG